MPTICRLIQIPPPEADALLADPRLLGATLEGARVHSDVYRYWDAMQYLLARHRPDSAAATWLGLGTAVSTATEAIPAARVVLPDAVRQLSRELAEIEPEALLSYYDADALDQAGVYPGCWKEWEETFDPSGQVLEHYSFLQQFTRGCASGGQALLLHFEALDEGTV
jgi:hypothetical protein